MIPSLSLLIRPPYNSQISGSTYDPYTLFIRSGDALHMLSSRLHYGVENILDESLRSFVQQMIMNEASLFHEEYHWIQQNGTTVGAFLALLRYSQERTTINHLTGVQPHSLSQLLNKRFSESPCPIVQMGNNEELDLSSLHENDPMNLFRQIWYDHQLISSIFNCSNKQDKISYPRGQVFGEITGDAILHFCDRCGWQYPGNELARKWYRFDEQEMFFVAAGNQRFTTRDLFEGVALANELELVFFRGTSNKHFIKFADQLDNSN